MTKKIKLILFIFGFIALAFVANFAFAQSGNDTFGIEKTNTALNGSLGISGTDPILVASRVIQIALSFLGMLALILTIYAGFLWMTSNGEEDRVTRAKMILRNAVIGLLIILASWAIVTFVISKLVGVTGGGANNPGAYTGGNFSDPGTGAIGSCTVGIFYPENDQKDVARNTSIIITFKEEIKLDTVCINDSGDACECGIIDNGKTCNKINPKTIRIFKTDLGDACSSGSCPNTNANATDVTVSVSSDKKTLILTPLSYLGSPTTNFWYSVKIGSDLKKIDGLSMFKSCASDYFVWKFEVSNRLDLTPPQVVYGKIFPRPDNQEDVANETQAALPAKALLSVSACPNTYSSSTIVSVTPDGNSPAASALPLAYSGDLKKFRVVVSNDSKDKVQLFDGNDDKNLLGVADFDVQGNAKFNNFFIFKAEDRSVGNAWIVNVKPEINADALTIGDEVYTFVSGPLGNNNIPVPNNCGTMSNEEKMTLVSTVYSVLSGDPLVKPEINANGIMLIAKVAGVSGNNINLSTTNPSAIQVQAFKDGIDFKNIAKTLDKKDVPMNTVIQVNFSEAINPLKISGLASEVKDYIKVVNYDFATAKASSSPCTLNKDCRSYKCEGAVGAKTCIGDYVNGKFLVSNSYKTVEFVSDNECGVNGCGEKIYCLPADSHLTVELRSADLKVCSTNDDCLALAPYSGCASTTLGYKTCQNTDGKNYPSANGDLNGVIDASLNSFDGDRNTYSDGPINYFSDNYSLADLNNLNKKDNYRWNFYVNDQINTTPPQIEEITPSQGNMGVNLAEPIKITWNTLMMNSSLTTGSSMVKNGSSTVEHKLINLKSTTPTAIGYWVENDNVDTEYSKGGVIIPLDGEPDKTISYIKHTAFSEAMSYRAQAGSGIKDIYQNCFKPSADKNCPVTATNPSCCFGKATSTLSADGNCQ
ncbi:MAG: pilin [Patescibacteria group bacterium]